MKHVQGHHYYVITVFLGLPGQEPELWEGPGEETEERSILVVLGVRLGPTGYPTALFSEKAKWSTHADCRWPVFSFTHQMSALWIRGLFTHCIQRLSVCLGQNTSMNTANLFSKAIVPEISGVRSTYPEGSRLQGESLDLHHRYAAGPALQRLLHAVPRAEAGVRGSTFCLAATPGAKCPSCSPSLDDPIPCP